MKIILFTLIISITSLANAFPKFMDSVAAEDIAQQRVEMLFPQVETCLKKVKPDAKFLTIKNKDELRGCYRAEQIANTFFENNDQKKIKLTNFKTWMYDHFLNLVSKETKDGYIPKKNNLDLDFYRAEKNARLQSAAKSYKSLDLLKLEELWGQVYANTALDENLILPVQIDPESLEGDIFAQLRLASSAVKSFEYVSTGSAAMEGFYTSGQGVDEKPKFLDLRDYIYETLGSVKSFYFVGGGPGWVSHVLIIVDKDGVMFGFQIGYSE